MHIEPQHAFSDITALLTECGLPVADLAGPTVPLFFGMRQHGHLVAVVGIELYPPQGLLRSLAVAPAFRGHGSGRALVAFAESFSAKCGIKELFLLTTSAEHFFQKLGYINADRNTAPAAIQSTSQFSSLCPASAVFLSREISEIR